MCPITSPPILQNAILFTPTPMLILNTIQYPEQLLHNLVGELKKIYTIALKLT